MTELRIFTHHRIAGNKDFNGTSRLHFEYLIHKTVVYLGAIFLGPVLYRLAYDVEILKTIRRCIFLKQA